MAIIVVSASPKTWQSWAAITAGADQRRDGNHDKYSRWHIHMCRKQHAVQVMAHGYLASIASEVRTCIACWGKRFRTGIGQRTLFVGQARHDAFASKS